MLERLVQFLCCHSYFYYDVKDVPHKMCSQCLLVKKEVKGKWKTLPNII